MPNNMLQSRTLVPFEPQTTDVLLTAGLMAYMSDVHQGAQNPRRKNMGAKLLREGVERSDFNVYLASLAPKGRSYSALKSVLNGREGPLSDTQKKQVAINMERLRWDHETAGALRDIRVNIASQTMEIFERGRKVRDMVVVVGRKKPQDARAAGRDCILEVQSRLDRATLNRRRRLLGPRASRPCVLRPEGLAGLC